MRKEDPNDPSIEGQLVLDLMEMIDNDLALKVHNFVADSNPPDYITGMVSLIAVVASAIALPKEALVNRHKCMAMAKGLANVLVTLTDTYLTNKEEDNAPPKQPSRLS